MFLYETKTYEKVGEFGDPAHGGGIYGVSVSLNRITISLYISIFIFKIFII